jgi:hypothetical protein
MLRRKRKVEVVPVFCFDPRFYLAKREDMAVRRTGIRRINFMLETVLALR